MLDRMGALGMISVFDVEEVGVEVLVNDVEMSQTLADTVVAECSAMSKVVAEQQQKEKEEEERRRAEEAAAADALLASQTDAGAELAADSILGGAPVEAAEPGVETADAADETADDVSEAEAETSEPDSDVEQPETEAS